MDDTIRNVNQPRRRNLGSIFPILVLIVLVAVIALSRRVAPVPEVFAQHASLDEAFESQARTGRPVLAVVTSNTCAPCQRLKRGPLTNPEVVSLIRDRTLPVSIVYQEEPDALERLGIRVFPTTLLLREGREVSRIEGYVPADVLLTWLDRHLAGVDSHVTTAD